jgi:putative hemolysin
VAKNTPMALHSLPRDRALTRFWKICGLDAGGLVVRRDIWKILKDHAGRSIRAVLYKSRSNGLLLTTKAVSIERAVRRNRQATIDPLHNDMAHPHTAPPEVPEDAQAPPVYRARLATSAADVQAAQALRFEVFNMELGEGLVQSYETGLDADPFDAVCDHLIVEDAVQGSVLGTYRLQTGIMAAKGLGYYSEREFDFAPFEARRSQILELGRACIHRNHRNFAVLNMLWKGIGAYAQDHGARYLIGCSSLTSQDPSIGAAAFAHLLPNLASADWCTRPLPPFTCPLDNPAVPAPRIPRLFSAYLAMGAAICGPPAIDQEFRTIDFLTWIDTQSPTVLAMQKRGRFIV